jgi:predicted lipoprotein with Yx(FWY)xxD motif
MRPLKRLLALGLTMGAGAGAITAVAVAPAIAGSTSSTPTIKLLSTSKGKILSTGGFVVYMFTHDKKNQNSCLKIKGCKSIWPAVTSAGMPKAGPGVKKSLLGTIKIAGGKHQVTYAGHALYRYSFDTKGSTSYIGISEFGGRWLALNAAGKSVK